jgi:hypothetical protein
VEVLLQALRNMADIWRPTGGVGASEPVGLEVERADKLIDVFFGGRRKGNNRWQLGSFLLPLNFLLIVHC